MTDAASVFESHRAHLTGLAYRMLGSLAEAEDVVQDAYLRWAAVERAAIVEPRAFLSTTVTRLSLDRLKSARSRREQYVGAWLPEPIVDDTHLAADAMADYANDLSVALLLTLERLSPLERAAFLLHDVFDMDFAAIGETLERSEAAVRQLAARARDHVHAERPRPPVSAETTARIAGAMRTAMLGGDLPAFAALLAEDAVLTTDGGGKRLAAINPIYGKAKILRFFVGIARKREPPTAATLEPVTLNGLPGFILRTSEGLETIAFEIAGEQIVAIYAVRNPDKLHHLES